MNDNASRFVGSIPENYDTGLGPHIFEPFAEDLARRVGGLAPSSVLELAAGTGIVSRRIKHALPETAMLTVTDLNEPMLEVAKGKLDGAGNTAFQAVDAMDLPFADASFDLILCQFGVMFFPDKVQSFREALRVLRPGGRYIFNAWGNWADNRFAEITYEATRRRYPDNPPGFYKVPFSYHDADEIERAMRSASFTDVTIEEVRFSDPIASIEDFSRGLIFGNPVSAEIEQRGGNCEEVRQELALDLRQQLGNQLDLMALVVTASKI